MVILKMVQFRARTQNAESIIFHIGHRFGVPSDTCSDIDPRLTSEDPASAESTTEGAKSTMLQAMHNSAGQSTSFCSLQRLSHFAVDCRAPTQPVPSIDCLRLPEATSASATPIILLVSN